MSLRALKPCKYGQCPKLTADRYCDAHAKLVEQTQTRDNAAAEAERRKFYNSSVWKHPTSGVRIIKLHASPMCEWEGCPEPASQVHHIKDIVDYPELRTVQSNLFSSCASCHSKETAKRNRMKGKCW